MKTIFFNAHHSPIGAFASFTLGYKGAAGGLGLELGAPADQSVYLGLESADASQFEVLPFFRGAAGAEEAKRYVSEQVPTPEETAPAVLPIVAFSDDAITREFRLGTDTWHAGDLTVTIYSPVRPIPDPDTATVADLEAALLPAVLAEITVDNTGCDRPRIACFGYTGSDPYSAMRRLDDVSEGRFVGIGQGRATAIVSLDDNVQSALGFTLTDILEAQPVENRTFGLGSCGTLLLETPAGEKRTYRVAICFYRGGLVTAGIDASYLYTRYFANIEAVADYALSHFESLTASAVAANNLLDVRGAHLSEDQTFMLVHAIRSYYGSTQLLDWKGRPFWIVNEGEYRMMNTLDLTVDQLFYELKMNPWTVRNELDIFSERYRYYDTVRLPGETEEHLGGVAFTHDMGVANVISRPEYSSYERYGLTGCFSHMTHEQLVNWVCCASIYVAQTGDQTWLSKNAGLLVECFTSMVNRDHPDPLKRIGIMQLDSSRTMGGAEITTYDSLDVSLGQSRGNIYLAGKCWACYIGLAKIFRRVGREDLAEQADAQARRCAATVVAHVEPSGYIPAVLKEGNDSRIVPAIEGLVIAYYNGSAEALDPEGEYGEYIEVLKRHFNTVLEPGTCLFPDGGWKLSSTSDNSWLSKIYLCQFVARHLLKIDGPHVTAHADAAHAAWLLRPKNLYWAWSDQMLAGDAVGSKYYPRGVTAILWLDESAQA